MNEPENCPSCGRPIESVASLSIGSGHPAETGQPHSKNEERVATCRNPECGAELRLVGGAWSVISRS